MATPSVILVPSASLPCWIMGASPSASQLLPVAVTPSSGISHRGSGCCSAQMWTLSTWTCVPLVLALLMLLELSTVTPRVSCFLDMNPFGKRFFGCAPV